MDFRRIWILRGPSIWARFPVAEAEVLLGELNNFRPAENSDFAQRLRSGFPAGRHLELGATLAHTLQHLTLELQQLAGSEVRYGLVHPTQETDFFRVVVEYEEEALVRACLNIGRDSILAAVRRQPYDLAARVGELRDLGHEVRLGPSTGSIVRAALQRGIPVRRLNTGSLVLLGQGSRQRRIWTAETDQTSAIGEWVAQDKDLTRSLLSAVGVPVPDGRPVSDAEDAWAAAEEIGPPVVVKPQYGNQGRGVATDLSTREQVVQAFEAAKQEGSSIIVEKYVPGSDHRLLVIGGKLVAAAHREPAHVIGDGRSTVRQLVEEVNKDPRRSDGHATPLSFIKLDEIGLAVLGEQGFHPDAIPPAGVRVLIRRNANLSTGGTAADITDRVHPEVAARAVEAARVVGLDIAGVDVVAVDVSRPLEKQGGAIVEVNAGPGLRMHLEPSAGKPRNVGAAIVDMLFPAGQSGRIPLVAVTGVNGKTTTTRLIAYLLQATGRKVGMTCTDGMYLDGRRTSTRDCSGPQSARAVLLNPLVEAAVLETARGGILREGLGFDRCDVAVVTNIGAGDHLGLRGIDTVEELARVKRTVVEAVAPEGFAVLNAADTLVAGMASACPGKVVFFSRDDRHPVVATHQAADGQAVLVRDGAIVLVHGHREEVLLPLDDVPMTRRGSVPFQVENVLAAAAAAWVLPIPLADIRAGLRTFWADPRQVPGRFNVFAIGGAAVIVDYAHNPSAVAALVRALDGFPARRRTLVFSGCNRRDVDVQEMGRLAGDGFDRVILYQDWGNNDRSDGELNHIFRRGLTAGQRAGLILDTASEKEALETALQNLGPDDLVVLGVEAIEDSLAWVHRERQRHEQAEPAAS